MALGDELEDCFCGEKVTSITPFAQGVGFLSLMHLCELEHDGKIRRIVTKELPPRSHDLYAFTKPLHEKELLFYTEFGNTSQLQDSICCSRIHGDILLLDYLEGYSMPDFLLGMNNNQVESAISALIPIHCIYWCAPNKQMEIPAWLKPAKSDLLPSLCRKFVKEMKNTMNDIGDILEAIENHIDVIITSSSSISKCRSVVHGDLWSNNILQKQESCKIVDWQFACHMNPLTDLAFLLTSSVSAELRKNREMQWVELYYNSLLKSLSISGKQYSFDQCKQEYQEAKLYALVIMIASFDSFYEANEGKNSDMKERYQILIDEARELLPALIARE